MIQLGNTVLRRQETEPREAQVAEIRGGNARIEYIEGGDGWWPLGELEEASPANWVGYQAALTTAPHVVALLSQCLSPEGLAIGGAAIFGGLVVGLGQTATGGSSATFLTAWGIARSAGLVSPALVTQMLVLAEPFDLPEDFLAAIDTP